MIRHRRWLMVLIMMLGVFVGGQGVSVATPAHANSVGDKRITLSIKRQRLRAWEGHKVVLVTQVSTGNPNLPTPVGHWYVFAKYHPYEFISPWPYGSAYYYPPSWVQYALEFHRGGYFLHDAPWRSVFGTASQRGGPPGTNYGGSHGCVNMPYWAARFLYYWAPIGTPVHVVP